MSDQMVSLVRCTRCATSLTWDEEKKAWMSVKTGKPVCPQGGPHKVFVPKLEDGAFDEVLAETPVQEEVAVAYDPDMDTATITTFNAQERCDRCGAQALAKATKEEMELLFCKHHINEQRNSLSENGWLILA